MTVSIDFYLFDAINMEFSIAIKVSYNEIKTLGRDSF